MFRIAGWLLLTTALTTVLTLCAQEPNLPEEVRPRAVKPQWQRMLTGADAKKAAELEKRIDDALEKDDYETMIRSGEEMLALRIRAQGADHHETAVARYELSRTRKVAALPGFARRGFWSATEGVIRAQELESRGVLPEALALKQQYLKWCRQVLGDDHPDTANAWNTIGLNLNKQGRYESAESASRAALEIRLRFFGDNHPDTANSFNNLAINLDGLGKRTSARNYLSRANAIFAKVFGEDHRTTATSRNNLAGSLFEQGQYEEAEPLFQKCVEYWNGVSSPESESESATAFHNAAANLRAQKKYAEAQILFDKSLTIRRKLYGEKHPDVAESYNSAACNLSERGKYAEAGPLFQKAIEIRRTLLGDDHPRVASAFNNLAESLNAQGNYPEAESFYRKALAIQSRSLGETHPETATTYSNLALHLNDLARNDEAEAVLRQAILSFESARLSGASGVRRASLTGFDPRLLLATLQASRTPEKAWASAELCLARGSLDEWAARRGVALPSNELAERAKHEARLGELRPKILALISGPTRSKSQTADLDSMLRSRRESEEALAALAVVDSQRQVAPSAAIRAAITSDAAIVLWIDLASRTGNDGSHWACVVRSTGEPVWVRLPGSGPEGKWSKDDSALPGRYRDALAAVPPSPDVDGLAKRLHAQRIAPILKHLEGIKTLYVVPVNWMAGIPVEVLAPQFTVGYIPSGTYLARAKDRAKPAGNAVLALGDPVFQSASSAASGWGELPGTRLELAALRRSFGDSVTTLADSSASEQSLEALRKSGDLARFRYLHFATHGEGNSVVAFESALILAQDRLPKEILSKPGEPFINGQLSANEVLEHWKLDAELVTLSACETAIGKSGGGEGLLGFAQAFLTAGARSVCLSLWKVDDTATALLMDRFYQNLAGKREGLPKPMGKAAALAEAKDWLKNLTGEEVLSRSAAMSNGVVRGKGQKALTVVAPVVDPNAPNADPKATKPFAHPRFWAAFVLIGDPN